MEFLHEAAIVGYDLLQSGVPETLGFVLGGLEDVGSTGAVVRISVVVTTLISLVVSDVEANLERVASLLFNVE